jgi:hypothetical protein
LGNAATKVGQERHQAPLFFALGLKRSNFGSLSPTSYA